MVLERSFNSADLKRLLLDNQGVVDRSLLSSSRREDPTRISRPPLPKGSSVFEKVLDEFQPERKGPQIRVNDATFTTTTKGHTHPHHHPHHHHHHHHPVDTHHLSPYLGRSRSNSRSDIVLHKSRLGGANSPVRSTIAKHAPGWRPGSESPN